MIKAFATPHHWIEFGVGRHPGQVIGLDVLPTFTSKHRSIQLGVSLLWLTAWCEWAYFPIARDVKSLTFPF